MTQYYNLYLIFIAIVKSVCDVMICFTLGLFGAKFGVMSLNLVQNLAPKYIILIFQREDKFLTKTNYLYFKNINSPSYHPTLVRH